MLITLLAVSGLKLTIVTICLGGLYIVCRILYTIGYVKGGPNWRIPGAMLNLPIIIGLFGTSIYACVALSQDGIMA